MDRWKVVDERGDEVMTADEVWVRAIIERRTARFVAEREAKKRVNVAAGDAPVFAVKEPA